MHRLSRPLRTILFAWSAIDSSSLDAYFTASSARLTVRETEPTSLPVQFLFPKGAILSLTSNHAIVVHTMAQREVMKAITSKVVAMPKQVLIAIKNVTVPAKYAHDFLINSVIALADHVFG
jgi:hypothetical protein